MGVIFIVIFGYDNSALSKIIDEFIATKKTVGARNMSGQPRLVVNKSMILLLQIRMIAKAAKIRLNGFTILL